MFVDIEYLRRELSVWIGDHLNMSADLQALQQVSGQSTNQCQSVPLNFVESLPSKLETTRICREVSRLHNKKRLLLSRSISIDIILWHTPT